MLQMLGSLNGIFRLTSPASVRDRKVVRTNIAAGKPPSLGEACVDLKTLSAFLGYAPQRIFFLVQARDFLYREIKIPKRDPKTGFREIDIPISELKGVQRSILMQVLRPHLISDAAYAYVTGRSAVAAARKTIGPHAQLKIDIRDFFPSIIDKRVFGLFRSLGFNTRVSYLLTRLTTCKGRLTQGSPTSPTISNLICRHLDKQLLALCESWNLNYLRYSDDLIFWGPTNFNKKRFSEIVYRILRDNNFAPNIPKTKFSAKGQPRKTLGLMSHGRHLRIPRKMLRTMRVAFFRATTNIQWARENLERLRGWAEYYKLVYGPDRRYQNYRRILENVRRFKGHEPYLVS